MSRRGMDINLMAFCHNAIRLSLLSDHSRNRIFLLRWNASDLAAVRYASWMHSSLRPDRRPFDLQRQGATLFWVRRKFQMTWRVLRASVVALARWRQIFFGVIKATRRAYSIRFTIGMRLACHSGFSGSCFFRP